jgi:hypothetical protein
MISRDSLYRHAKPAVLSLFPHIMTGLGAHEGGRALTQFVWCRWFCQREAANQQAELLTGDVFYHAMEDKSELEFESLNRYFQASVIRATAREIMATADQFSVNSQLSMTEVTHDTEKLSPCCWAH